MTRQGDVEENKKSKTNTDRTTGGRKWEEEKEEGKNVYKMRAHPREKKKKKKHKRLRKQEVKEGKEISKIRYKLRQLSQNSARTELNLFKHTQTRNQL